MKGFADGHIHIRGGKFEEIEKMLDELAEIGVTEVSLLALPFRSVSENLSALYWKMKYQKMKVRAFGGLHQTDRYSDVPYEQQVKQLLALGCDGIKLMDQCPDIRKYLRKGINDPVYDPMLTMLEELGTPVVLHANDPYEKWEDPKTAAPEEARFKGLYLQEGFLTYEEIYKETREMLDKHPKLNIVLAHFFFHAGNLEGAVEIMETYPNVRFDLTPGSRMFLLFSERIEEWREFFVKYSDRILFGTDTNTFKDFNKEIHELVYLFLTHDHTKFEMPCYGNFMIRGLGLDADIVEKICYHNYHEFVGNEVKPVDLEGFYESAAYILEDMRTNTEDKYYEEAAKEFNDLSKDPKQETAIRFFERVLEERK